MKRLFFFLILLAATRSLYASLGDQSETIDNAYGGSVVQRHLRDDGTLSIVYHRHNDKYVVTVLFDRGVSVIERYSRVDKRDLSEKEIARFLKANAGSTITWTSETTPKGRKFSLSNNKVDALYGEVDGIPSLTVKVASSKAKL